MNKELFSMDYTSKVDSGMQEKKEIQKEKKKSKSSRGKKKGVRKPKKKEIKQKNPSIWQQLAHMKSATDEQLARFYTGIITGDVKDFTGLEASIDTKLKAAKLILEINSQKRLEEQRKQEMSLNVQDNKKDATDAILDMLSDRVKKLEEDVFEEDEQ